MDDRSLREVFDRLAAGEPVALPPDLDPPLVAEALVGYADSAPLHIAEHLEEFVVAVTSGEEPDLTEGLTLLETAPAGEGDWLDLSVAATADPWEEESVMDSPADDVPEGLVLHDSSLLDAGPGHDGGAADPDEPSPAAPSPDEGDDFGFGTGTIQIISRPEPEHDPEPTADQAEPVAAAAQDPYLSTGDALPELDDTAWFELTPDEGGTDTGDDGADLPDAT